MSAWVKLMSFATITALIYVHMQTQIVDLAYKGKVKETAMGDLMDNNGALTHQIMSLKSADHLGRELLEKDAGLQFIGQNRIMTLSSGVPRQKGKQKGEGPAWNILSFLSLPEARAWDR